MPPATATMAPAAGSLVSTIDAARWEKELAGAQVDKADLNTLILDYLRLEGFPDAAAEFARETGLPWDDDHARIQERMEIRNAVEDGRVEEAVRRVNELDPELDAALTFATVELAPRGAQNPEFLPDLERTMALLAFPDLAKFSDDEIAIAASTGSELFADPAFKPISQLMKRAQRIKVAKELNAAILESQGLGVESKLGGLVRLMSWGEERLESVGIKLPEEESSKGRLWASRVLASELR